MTTEVRQGYVEQQAHHRDVGAGGEEVFELEKGVRVRKSGGVELAPTLSAAEVAARHSEISSQIEHQKLIIARAKEEAVNAARQANEQEILAREALEFKDFNRNRQMEAAAEARQLMIEVTALVEKEKDLERARAAAHHAAVEKERERVQAKTAEIIAREEAIEAEKREQYYRDLIRKCNSLTLKYKLEEEQARLKMESLQFSLQHGDFSTAAANKAKIVVEVEPRDLPEARQFDTSQVEVGIASAEMGQEGMATIADTRSIEEIVMTERKHRTSSASSSSYASQRGNIRSEESYGLHGSGLESESRRNVDLREETPSSYAATSIVPPTMTPTSSGDNIKVLPDIKPSASEQGLGVGGLNQPMSSSGEHPFASGVQQGVQHPYGQQAQQQGFVGGSQAQQYQQPAQQASSTTAGETAGAAVAGAEQKKQKSGGFFKKFKSTKSHEQGH